MQTQKSLDEFKNEPFTDFTKTENADAIKRRLNRLEANLGAISDFDKRRKDYA
jgi:ribosomal protein S2